MNDSPAKTPGKAPALKAAQADALKRNLARRKAQARGQEEPDGCAAAPVGLGSKPNPSKP